MQQSSLPTDNPGRGFVWHLMKVRPSTGLSAKINKRLDKREDKLDKDTNKKTKRTGEWKVKSHQHTYHAYFEKNPHTHRKKQMN